MEPRIVKAVPRILARASFLAVTSRKAPDTATKMLRISPRISISVLTFCCEDNIFKVIDCAVVHVVLPVIVKEHLPQSIFNVVFIEGVPLVVQDWFLPRASPLIFDGLNSIPVRHHSPALLGANR